jgi:hypothetical protein
MYHQSMANSSRRPTPRRQVEIRRPTFDFATTPRHWFGGHRVASIAVDALNLLFPAGERFFVRSVRHYQKQLDDPELVAQVRGFMGQEVRHGMEHERFFATLEAQGFDLQRFLRLYDRVAYGIIEPASSPALRLSVTVALEHFTAHLAELALRRGLVAQMHPEVRALIEWHALEEIEHKSVAFDVLEAVDDRWLLRAAGMLVGASVLGGFFAIAFVDLLLQDLAMGATPETTRRWPFDPRRVGLVEAVRTYLTPRFHPDQRDDGPLVAPLREALRPAA